MRRPPKTERSEPLLKLPKPVSLKTLAQHLRLSPATVSAVINDAPAARSIPQDTKDRIFKAVAEFDYRPNFVARSLRQKRTYTVAVIVPEISEGYAATILAGIEERLVAEGYLYFVASHRNQDKHIREYPPLLLHRAVEGFILVNTPLTHELPVPVVSIAGQMHGKGITRILLDNATGCRLALEHLVGLGHREIAFFKGHPGSADTESRWEGICRAAQDLGIAVPPELSIQLKGLSACPEPSTPEEGYAYAQRLLDRKQRFTALFAFNDTSAIGAVSALRDAGFRVPQDISVVGFDDVKAAAFQNPRLTTVRQPLLYMGELAARTLLGRIANSGTAIDEIRVEPEFVVRESTCAVSATPRRISVAAP